MAKKKKRLEDIERQKKAAGVELKKTPTPKTPTPKKPTPKRIEGSSVAGQGFTHFSNAPKNVPYKAPVETGTERMDRYRREIRPQNPGAVTGAERMDRSRAESERRRQEYATIAQGARIGAAKTDYERRAEAAIAQIMMRDPEEAERQAPMQRQAARALSVRDRLTNGLPWYQDSVRDAGGGESFDQMPKQVQEALIQYLDGVVGNSPAAPASLSASKPKLLPWFSDADLTRLESVYRGNEDPNGNIYADTATMYDYMAKIEAMPTDIRQSFDKLMQIREDFQHQTPEYQQLSEYIGDNDELQRLISAYNRFHNSAKAEQTAERFAQRAEELPGTVYAENLATPVYSLGAAVVEPIGIAGEWVDRLTGKSPFKTGDPNAPFYQLSDQSARVRGATSQAILGEDPNFGNKALNTLYSGAMSAMDNGARILAGYIMGNPYASLALAGTGSFASAYRDATARGAEPVRAALYGGANAALEVATEKLPLDRLINISDKNVLADILKSALTEVGEEEASFFGGMLADAIIMGQNSNNQLALRQYMENGMTEEQARQAVLKDILGEAAETAFTSAISSGIMTGANRAIRGIGAAATPQLTPDEINAMLSEDSSAPVTEVREPGVADTPGQATLSEKETVDQRERRLDEMYPQDGVRYSYAGRQAATSTAQTEEVDSSGRKVSPEQSAYFSKSKARDKTGKLKPVYHGSGADFTEFSYKHLGKSGTAEGVGFYFTDDPSIAERYSTGPDGQRGTEDGRVYEGYVNITKPLSDKKVTITRAAFKRFLKALDSAVDEDGERFDVLSNYGDTDYEGLPAVLATAVEMEFDGNDNDVDLIHSIMNQGFRYPGRIESFYKVLKDTTGYDGIIVEEPTWGGNQTIYLAFSPEQFKLADNAEPTTSRDMRFSARDTQQSAKTVAQTTRLTPGKVTFDGDEKKLTKNQRTNMACLRVVAEALNVPIHVFESKVDPETGKRVGANGWYDPKDGSIHIDLHAGADGAGTMMFTAAHEVVHLIRDRALDEYDFLRGFVFHGMLTPEIAQSLVEKQISQARQQGRIITKDIATEEVVANSLEAVLTRKDAFKSLQKIQAKNKSLFERIRMYFSNLSSRLSRLYSGLRPDSEEARIVESASIKSKDILYQFRRAISGAVTAGQKLAEKVQQEDRDNSGRTLSAEQERYFEDSTVRDYAGRLKRVYHGSGSFFSQFTYEFVGKSGLHEGLGFYFTDSREIADRYSTGPDRRRGTESGTVYEVYLNLHNTLSGDRVTMEFREFSRFLDAAKNLGAKNGIHIEIDAEDFYTQSTSDVELVNKVMFAGFAKHGAALAEEFLRTLQRTTGYDGTEVRNPDWGGDQTIYLAFFPDQIKLVSNKNPTTSRDIRFSTRDGEFPFTFGDEEIPTDEPEYDVEQLESLAGEPIFGHEELARMVQETDSAIRELKSLTAEADKPYVEGIVDSAAKLKNAAKNLYNYWQKMPGKRGGKKMYQALHAPAKSIKKNTGTTLSINEIRDELREVYNAMYQGLRAGVQRAEEAATAIFSAVTGGENTLYEQYSEARAYFRGHTITISESAAADIPDFRDLQRRYFGKVKIQKSEHGNIDADWEEISQQMADLVDADALTQSDMLLSLLDGLDKIYDSKDDAAYSQRDIYRMAQEYAYKLIADLSDLEFRDETLAEKREPFVRQIAQDLSSEDGKAKMKVETAVAEVKKFEYKLNDSLLAGKENAASQIRQGLRAVQKLRFELLKKGANDEQIGAALRDTRQTLQALNMASNPRYALSFIDRANERYERLKKDKSDGKLRASIFRNFKNLLSKLTTNSDAKHIPETMKKPIIEILTSIDPTSRRVLKGGAPTGADTYVLTKLTELENVLLNGLTENGNICVVDGVMLDIPPDMIGELQEIHKKLEEAIEFQGTFTTGLPLAKMPTFELERLNKTLSTIVECVSKANKILSGETGRRLDVYAKGAIQDFDGYEPDEKEHRLDRFMTSPIYFFEQLGDSAKFIWDSLVRSDGKWADNREAVRDFAHATWTREQIQEWETHTHTFTTDGGKKITLCDAQIMSLYCHNQRKQGKKHILGDGIRVDAVKAAKIKVGAKSVKLTADDVEKLIKLLSKEQVEMAQKIQEFMTKVGGKLGNEISLKRFGYKKYTERFYFPIRTDPATKDSTADRAKNTIWHILNYGYTKKTAEQAPQAVMLGSIFDEYANHMEEMARHNAFSLAILDAMRWFNYSVSDDDGKNHKSVHGTMEAAFGQTATNYFLDLMADISSPKTTDTDPTLKIPRWLTRKWKMAKVALSLSTIIKQPLSYVRAGYVLDTKAMARAFGTIPDSKFQREKKQMYAHNGIARIKGTGYMDAYNSRGFKDEVRHDKGMKLFGKEVRLGDIAMKGAAWMDEQTWVRIWIACKWQACGYKGENFDSPETIAKASELFTETIYKTQVVESQLAITPWRRSNNFFAAMFTPFSSENNLSYNVLMQGYRQYQNEVRRTNKAHARKLYSKQVRRGIAWYMASSIADALIESIIGAYRDDDEFMNFFQKFLEKLLGEGVLQGDLVGLVGGNLINSINPLGKIPGFDIIPDVLLSAIKGYTNERVDTESLTKFFNLAMMWSEFIRLQSGDKDAKPSKLTAYGKMNLGGAIVETLRNADLILGTGIGNVARTVQTTWNNIANIYNDTRDEGEDRISKITKYDNFTEKGVAQAFKDGYLTITEAAEQIQTAREAAGDKPYTDNELYWKMKELETWDEEKGRGVKQNDEIDLAVLAGDTESITEAAEEIKAHSDNPPENPVKSAVLRVYKDSMRAKDERNEVYEGKTISRADAHKLLTEVAGLREDQAHAELEKAEYEILHGDSTGFSVYSTVYDTMRQGGDIENAVTKLIDSGFVEEQVMSGAKELVTNAYKTGAINKSQATTIMQKYYDMDKKELYQYFGKAEYEAKGYGDTYSAYNEVYSLVSKGGDISAQVKELTKNGYTEQEVYEQAAGEAHRLFKEGEISEQKAAELMKKYSRTTEKMSASDKQAYFKKHGKMPEDGVLRELTENELYWKMDEWSWKRQNPDGKYEKYRNWYSAIESGEGVRQTIKEFESHGVSQTTLKDQLSTHYKQAYLDAYFANDSAEASRIRQLLVRAYVALGMTSGDAYKKLRDWVAEERKNRR